MEAKQKTNLLSAFWESCVDLSFYSRAHKIPWWQVGLYTFALILVVAFSYSVATYVPLTKNLTQLYEELPTIQVQGGSASFDSNLKLPKIYKFPGAGRKTLYYIVDSGTNRAELEEKHEMYILFTQRKVIFNDSKKRYEAPWRDVEKDDLMKSFFGDPIKITPDSLARFTASVAMFFVGVIFFLIVLLFLPAFNFFAAFVSSIVDKWPLSFLELAKLSFFAATPACLIQAFGCFFLSGTSYLTVLIAISWIVQIAYLITGLKMLKESNNSQIDLQA